MGKSLVIVAIPEEQDRVHRVSSEQVPHLTLLYLGDVDQVQNVDQIMQFVDHAVTLSEHGPFYLDVDRRGTLGEKEADVLFFNKRSWNLKWIRQFRGQLLQNQSIRTAFDATEQILEAPQEWLPHLTLGYPEKPAKPLPDDGFDHPFYSVCFDRIAVWAEEYNGPEFPLEWPERELDGDLAIAYADECKKALMHNGVLGARPKTTPELGEDFLEHFGVKGMRWGFRKETPAQSMLRVGESKQDFKDARKDAKWLKKNQGAKHPGQMVKADKRVFKDAQKTLKPEIKQLNKKPEYSSKEGKKQLKDPSSELAQKYDKEHASLFAKHMQASLEKNKSTSPSGKWEDKLNIESDGSWFVGIKRTDSAKHDALDDMDFVFHVRPVRDTERLIEDYELIEEEVSHEDYAKRGEEFLEHYGIKGMRWGIRRDPPSAVAPVAASRVPHGSRRKTKIEAAGGENHPAHEDALKVAKAKAKLKKSGTAALSNQELADVANRIRLEAQVTELTRNAGSKWVRKFLGNQGNQAANQIVRTEVDSRIRKQK